MKIKSVWAAVFAAVAIASAVAVPALAIEGSFPLSRVKAIEISNFSSHAWVILDNTAVVSPACVPSDRKNAFAFRIDNDKGRAYLSILTAAFLSGKRVKGSTTGDCPFPEVNNTEGLAWLKMQD